MRLDTDRIYLRQILALETVTAEHVRTIASHRVFARSQPWQVRELLALQLDVVVLGGADL